MTSVSRRRPNVTAVKWSDSEYLEILAMANRQRKPLASWLRDVAMAQVRAEKPAGKPTEYKHGNATEPTGYSRYNSGTAIQPR